MRFLGRGEGQGVTLRGEVGQGLFDFRKTFEMSGVARSGPVGCSAVTS